MDNRLPDGIANLCSALVEGLLGTLGDKLHSVIVYGAAVFPETEATGDVDLHVILEGPLSELEKDAIVVLHEALAQRFAPLGAELDAYYLLLEEARRSELPTHQLRTDIVDESWALHRAHMLAGRCVVLYGPKPRSIFPEPTWPEIEEALAGELAYVEEHLDRYPDYCILNLCRLMYSYNTGNVVTSKAAASAWATARFPQWSRLIDFAKRSYAGASADEERAAMLREVGSLLDFAKQQIRRDSRGISGGGFYHTTPRTAGFP